MFIELDKNNQFTAYCRNLSEVAPEHSKFVIQATDALCQLLNAKMAWSMVAPDFTKIYDVPDIDLFVEIVPIVLPTLQSQIDNNSAAISFLMGV